METSLFALVLSAACCHAGWNYVARTVTGNFVVFWLGICFASIAITPVAIGIALLRPVFSGTHTAVIAAIAATSILHAIYFIALAKAYKRGEISVVYPIARGSGIGLTAIAAWILLNEQPGLIGGTGILLVIMGIFAMGLPAWRKHRGPHNIAPAIAVGITIPVYSVVDDFGVTVVHPVIYVWSMYVFSALLLAPIIARRYKGIVMDTARSYRTQIVIIGLGGMLTYLAILFAYQLGPVSYIAAARESSVVIAAALGFLLLREHLGFVKVLAILAITAGLLCIRIA